MRAARTSETGRQAVHNETRRPARPAESPGTGRPTHMHDHATETTGGAGSDRAFVLGLDGVP